MTEQTKALARRWFQEVWNDRNDAAILELMDPDSVGHVEGGEARGPEAFRSMRATFLSAVPDLRVDVEDIVADGEDAVVRWRVVGTHDGDGFGFPSTGRAVDARGMTWLVFRNGRVVEGWDCWNLHGLLLSLQSPEEKKALF